MYLLTVELPANELLVFLVEFFTPSFLTNPLAGMLL